MSIRQGLLALLGTDPKHGYQLKTEFESATGGMWPINVGQVYTTLDRLVRDGLVEADTDGEQKQYRLTLDGAQQLGRWWQSVPSDEPPPRDELMVKVLLAIATAPDEALSVITAQRTAVFELLQLRRRQMRAANHDGASAATAGNVGAVGAVGDGRGQASVAEALAGDALIVRAEADLRWLDLCEARVLDQHRKPKKAVGKRAVSEAAVAEAASAPQGGDPTSSSQPTNDAPRSRNSSRTRSRPRKKEERP